MKTSSISTQSLWSSPRLALNKIQTELAQANKEMTSGRAADVGLKLGLQTGTAFSVRQEMSFLDSLITGNALVEIRLDGAYRAMDTVRTTAEGFAATLISVPPGERNLQSVVAEAQNAFMAVADNLNRSVNGEYVFGGANTNHPPIAPYIPGSPAKTALENAFLGHFGFTASDPAVATITPEDLSLFLEGPFAAQFDDAQWQANWSTASDTGIMTRISENVTVDTATSANDAAFRKISMGFTMLMELGVENMAQSTRETLMDKAIGNLLSGADRVADKQAQNGQIKEKMSSGNEVLKAKVSIYREQISVMEGVDPIEAKVRIDEMQIRLQMSLAQTAQMRSLSLVNYL